MASPRGQLGFISDHELQSETDTEVGLNKDGVCF